MRTLRIRYLLRLHSGRVCATLPRKRERYYLRWRNCLLELTWLPWNGIYVTHLWRVWEPLVQLNPPDVSWERPCMKKKNAKTGAEAGNHVAAVETKIFDGMMAIIEHMALTRYEDGDPRVPGWLRIDTHGAAWRVKVNDVDSGMSFTSIAETLDKALETAALWLACDEAPWELDRFLVQQKGGRKKSS